MKKPQVTAMEDTETQEKEDIEWVVGETVMANGAKKNFDELQYTSIGCILTLSRQIFC